jgi:PAS domain S-box-containing protein
MLLGDNKQAAATNWTTGDLMTDLDNNDLCRQIVALAPDAILFADQRGIIRLWNQGAERIFGCSANDAIGQSLDLIIPEKLRKRHWDGYHKTMATGETSYGIDLLAVPAMHQNGSRLSTEFSIVMLNDDSGKPIGVAAILRDVTERHQKEKRMLDRLADLEAAHEI